MYPRQLCVHVSTAAHVGVLISGHSFGVSKSSVIESWVGARNLCGGGADDLVELDWLLLGTCLTLFV